MMADEVTGQAGVVVPQAVAQLGYQQLEVRKRIAMHMLVMQRAKAMLLAQKAAQAQTQAPQMQAPEQQQYDPQALQDMQDQATRGA